MSIAAAVYLYNGPNKTGSSLLAGLSSGDRYAPITYPVLLSHGLANSVASGELHCSAADFNVILFQNEDYTGDVVQVSLSRNDGFETFWHTGPALSAMLIASNNVGTTDHRVSFVDTFRNKWDSFIDDRLSGTQVSRDVEPLLTWQMFPESNQWLSSHQTYLRIHQPLHVHMPWYWADYQASMDYNVVLFVTGENHLRAWVADWECWVEGGAKNGKIHNKLDPKVEAGRSDLQDQLNQQLAFTDLLGPVKSAFYLPGRQLNPIGSAIFGGNTSDDITIVIQT